MHQLKGWKPVSDERCRQKYKERKKAESTKALVFNPDHQGCDYFTYSRSEFHDLHH